MQDATTTRQPTRARQVVALVVALALVVGGFLWYRHVQDQRQHQACVDMYAYTMWLDKQDYSGPVQDPTFLKNRERCFG